MNILFLTMGRFDSIEAHSIYADLLRCFRNHGHIVYTIAPYEKRTGKKTELIYEKGAHVLHIETGDVTAASNLVSKGLAQIHIETTYIKAIEKYFSNVKFDLVMYSTPPITFYRVVDFVKKRDGARSYLLLKDIFPQNAVDLGMMSKTGMKGAVYKYFRKKEIKLYSVSDRIGCMSQANVDYVIKHNPEIDPSVVEICPNSIEVIDKSVNAETRRAIREKYEVPQDKIVFVYGGNLGKPQGIPFLIECLRKCADIDRAYFLIIGGGTEYHLLEKYVDSEKTTNVKLIKRLPKEEFDTMVGACDIGLLFLDHRFTIPNFPSRMLSYMAAKLPILACTDSNTDVGKTIVDGGFGWWCESKDGYEFYNMITEIINQSIHNKKERAAEYLLSNYSVERAYSIIMRDV